MKKAYRLYRPHVRIEDIRRPSSYYQSPDVTFTPFTHIGQLVDAEEQITEMTPDTIPTSSGDVAPIEINNKRRPRPPIFPANFLAHTDTGFGRPEEETSSAAVMAMPTDALRSAKFASIGATLAALGNHAHYALTRPWQALRDIHPQWAHRRYIVDRGWQMGLLENVRRHKRAIAGVCFACGVVLLLVFLKPGLPKSPAQDGNSVSGTGTYSQTSGKTNQTTAPNEKTGTSSQAASSSADQQSASTTGTSSTSINPTSGGMGGGPTNTDGSSLPGIPGVTTPLPITVPGQTVDQGGKQVVGTDPVVVTLN